MSWIPLPPKSEWPEAVKDFHRRMDLLETRKKMPVERWKPGPYPEGAKVEYEGLIFERSERAFFDPNSNRINPTAFTINGAWQMLGTLAQEEKIAGLQGENNLMLEIVLGVAVRLGTKGRENIIPKLETLFQERNSCRKKIEKLEARLRHLSHSVGPVAESYEEWCATIDAEIEGGKG